MAEALAFAAPKGEEMTSMAVNTGGALVTGIAEGVMIKVAPQTGKLEPVITWGTLVGVPLIGCMGALFTRGMAGDLFQGVASAGVGILGYSLPALVGTYYTSGKTGSGAGPGGGQRDVKMLPAGSGGAPQRAQNAVRAGMEF